MSSAQHDSQLQYKAVVRQAVWCSKTRLHFIVQLVNDYTPTVRCVLRVWMQAALTVLSSCHDAPTHSTHQLRAALTVRE